jgi:cell shape-determining protein MreD
MRYRLRTLLTLAMVGTAVFAFAGCPLIDSGAFAWYSDFDTYDFSRYLAIGFLLASLACSVAGLVVALASEERVPTQFWVGHLAASAFSALLWFLTLPWIQAARE